MNGYYEYSISVFAILVPFLNVSFCTSSFIVLVMNGSRPDCHFVVLQSTCTITTLGFSNVTIPANSSRISQKPKVPPLES